MVKIGPDPISRKSANNQKKARREEFSGQGGFGDPRSMVPRECFGGWLRASPDQVFVVAITVSLEDAPRGDYAVGQGFERFALRCRRRVLAVPGGPGLARRLALAGKPVPREFGGEGFHGRLIGPRHTRSNPRAR